MERRAGWQGNREALEPLSLRANPVPGVVRSAAGWRPGDIWLPRVPAAPTAHGKESRPPWVTAPLRGKESERGSHHLVDHSNPAPAKPTASEGWAGAETGSPGFLSGLSGHGRRKVTWSHQLQVHI